MQATCYQNLKANMYNLCHVIYITLYNYTYTDIHIDESGIRTRNKLIYVYMSIYIYIQWFGSECSLPLLVWALLRNGRN